MKEDEVDAALEKKSKTEYMRSKCLLYPICNALMITSRHKQLVLTKENVHFKQTDSKLKCLFRGLIPFTLSNSIHIMLSAAFQVSIPKIKDNYDWYYSAIFSFSLA